MKYDIRQIDRSRNQSMLALFEHTSVPFESKASIKPNEDIFYIYFIFFILFLTVSVITSARTSDNISGYRTLNSYTALTQTSKRYDKPFPALIFIPAKSLLL